LKVLIIGSKGFIGSHTLQFLTEKQGFQCWGCDVVVDYVDQRYFLVDAANSDFNDIFKSVAFDFCINCSGAASVQSSMVNPYRDFILNTANVFKILETMRKENPSCKFLNISSAAVYGNPSTLPISETQIPNPLSPYGLHKFQAEEICREFNQYYGLATCSARVFSAYGPGLKKQLFWDVYHKAKGKSTITMAGTGNETRDFIFIDDLVQALYLIVNHAAFHGECINVASGIETKVTEAVNALLAVMPWQGEVVFDRKERKGDPLFWKADISKLASYHYHNEYSLMSGLEKYVLWLNERKQSTYSEE